MLSHFVWLGSAFSAFYLLSEALINNAGPAGCWIAPCQSNFTYNPDVDCIRGENIHVTRWIFNYAFILLTFLVIIVTMSMMFWSVWRQEARMSQYRFGSNFGSASWPQSATNNETNSQYADETNLFYFQYNKSRKSLVRSLGLVIHSANGTRPVVPSYVPAYIRKLIVLSWDHDQQKRPSFAYISMFLTHYIKSWFWGELEIHLVTPRKYVVRISVYT